MKILQKLQLISRNEQINSNPFNLSFGPFNSFTQIRWKKPANTAQTRLENRIRDLKLDRLTAQRRRLNLILDLRRLISARKRCGFVSVQSLSKLAPHAGIETLAAGDLLRKYPHVFEVFTHPTKRNRCFRFTAKFVELINEEEEIITRFENEAVMRVKKLLLMSVNGSVHLHAIGLIRNELGLPENFRELITSKYDHEFKMVDLEIVELADTDTRNPCLVAEVEKWRAKEYTERWLSEFEVKYAFPINFPTGFKIEPGFREKLRNWQRLSYVKPYEKTEVLKRRTCGGVECYEKRAVGIIHELLCLTIEKMVPVERLAHFRNDLGIKVNVRELLLKHPGIFYISTKGNTQLVYLREAYSKGCLIEPNPVYDVRRKLLELIWMGSRNTRELKSQREVRDEINDNERSENSGGGEDGDFLIPILECFDDQ